MKERPILFSGEMVRAIIDGRKTMTRRVVKPQPEQDTDCPYHIGTGVERKARICPYGKPGDRLWVRETHTYGDINYTESDPFADVYYRADDICLGVPVSEAVAETVQEWVEEKEVSGAGCNWRPSIFMPRWASRITLEITNIRVERLQDISEEDAKREGANGEKHRGQGFEHCIYREAFRTLWESINAKRGYSWESNPWVWVVEFKQIKEVDK